MALTLSDAIASKSASVIVKLPRTSFGRGGWAVFFAAAEAGLVDTWKTVLRYYVRRGYT
jgi:hypothetical protein